MDVPRISPQDARARFENGALMVCAYEDELTCGSMMIRGAISMAEFRKRRSQLSRDMVIIFYCA